MPVGQDSAKLSAYELRSAWPDGRSQADFVAFHPAKRKRSAALSWGLITASAASKCRWQTSLTASAGQAEEGPPCETWAGNQAMQTEPEGIQSARKHTHTKQLKGRTQLLAPSNAPLLISSLSAAMAASLHTAASSAPARAGQPAHARKVNQRWLLGEQQAQVPDGPGASRAMMCSPVARTGSHQLTHTPV